MIHCPRHVSNFVEKTRALVPIMCRGITKKGKPCKCAAEPYCRYHMEQQQIRPIISLAWAKFERGPTKADGPGYIYAYFVNFDPADTYYKIGSSVDPTKRIANWKGTVKKVYYVHFRQLAERIIHLELDKARVYRYLIDDGTYCTIWKANSEPVEPSDLVLKAKHQLHGFQKHVEWFRLPWVAMQERLSIIVNLINDKGYRRY
jgi:hypothetical protein